MFSLWVRERICHEVVPPQWEGVGDQMKAMWEVETCHMGVLVALVYCYSQ